MDDKENILFFFVAICLLGQRMVSASCEQVDVGVSWYILDNQLNASSELNASTPAKNGRLNFVAGSSWCASTSDSSPYLQIDLQIPYIICAVSTQGNSQGSQWVESYTLQSSTNGTAWTDYKESGQVKTFNGNFDQNSVEKQILFSAFVARYLRFVVGSTHGGACLRVEVSGIPRSSGQSNIALFKPTSQSSTHNPWYASNAVDGNKGLQFSKCTHTTLERDPWWRVDLGQVEPVAEVNILNRGDCCGARLNGAEIRVGNETTNGGANNSLCANNIQIPQGGSKTYSCRPKAYGRYLYIRIPGRNKILTLCEVEVYSLTSACPKMEILTGTSGIITSPSYPGNYGNNQNCGWIIMAGTGNRVKLVIQDMDIKSGSNCQYDYIQIQNAVIYGSSVLPGRLCGSIISNSTFSSYHETLIVRFVTDGSETARGFKARYTVIPHASACPNMAILTGTSGTITSPSYPGYYGNNHNCSWKIMASTGNRVKLVIQVMDIESGTNCPYDYIQIQNAVIYGSGVLPGRLCGSLTSNSTFSSYNETMIIRFVTDGSIIAHGFKARYTVIPNAHGFKARYTVIPHGCVLDPVGVSKSSVISDRRFSASSSLSSRSPSDGRLNGSNTWIPATNNDNNDFLQIDLGSLYFVCGVETQGNPNNDYWTKTYKIETSLDNVVWTFYSEGGSEKIFTGNDDKNSIVRSELYEPLAAKFIRFYPVTFHNRKALRVEVYGSKQGCFESFKNERLQTTREFTITASSEVSSYRADYSRLYGTRGWCSSSVSLPQYLQADFNQIVTVTGVATQGDAQRNNRVTSYLIRYGYDGKTWISYGAGQHLTGNSDRSTIVVHWFAPPFAAQYVRIFPKTYTGAICMRMDLFGCKDYQVSLPLNVNLDDVGLIADTSESVTLTCVASYSPRQPSGYGWSKDGAGLSDTTSSLTIPYNNASNIYNTSCTRKLPSARGVQCNSTYRCSTSLSGIQGSYLTTANVIVSLKKPGKPVVQVNPSDVKARSALVTWPYNPGADEMPVTAYNLEYRNSTSTLDIHLGLVLSKRIINLKPYTAYSVRVLANSVLGKSLWSNFTNFTTKTARPEVDVQIVNVTSHNSQTILVKWQTPSSTSLNGPFRGYSIEYKEEGKPSWTTVNVSDSSTDKTLQSLKKWTVYFIRIAVSNGDFLGPPGPEKQVRTLEDAPSKPQKLVISFQEPSEITMPRMTVQWQQPAEQNGIIRKYRLVLNYTIDGRQTTNTSDTNNQTFSHSLDVFGGIQYSVEIWAETVKPGPRLTGAKQVPEYKPSASPQNITSKKINKTTYRISWNPLSRDKSNGRVIAYEVNQTRLSTSRNARPVCTPSVLQNATDAFIDLTGLSSCSVYKVEVRAYTSAGPGVFGRLTRNIAYSVPGEPTDVKTENPGKRSITLRWGKPKLHGDDVRRYKIIYKGTKDYYTEFKPHTGIQETDSPTLTMNITDLYPGTEYTFVVRAENHCVYGGNSSTAQGSTKVDAPVAPVYHEVQVIITYKTPVNVTVWPAKQTNGPISDYQVLVHQVNDWTDEVSEWNTLGKDVYIAAQIPANSTNPSIAFVVGDGKTYDGYENKQLSNGQKYKIYSRGLARRVTKKRSGNQNYLFGKASLIAKVQIDKVYKCDDADRQGGDTGSQSGDKPSNTVYKCDDADRQGGDTGSQSGDKPSNSVYKCDDANRQGGDTGSQSGDKPSNTAPVISSVVLGIALVISLGVHLYQWRARGISKYGKKYSVEELQVIAYQNEGGDAEVPSPKVGSFHMELQPTQIQQTTKDSEYESLI